MLYQGGIRPTKTKTHRQSSCGQHLRELLGMVRQGRDPVLPQTVSGFSSLFRTSRWQKENLPAWFWVVPARNRVPEQSAAGRATMEEPPYPRGCRIHCSTSTMKPVQAEQRNKGHEPGQGAVDCERPPKISLDTLMCFRSRDSASSHIWQPGQHVYGGGSRLEKHQRYSDNNQF